MQSIRPFHLHLISPASHEGDFDNWNARLQDFELAGITVSYHKLEPDPSWPFHAGTAEHRQAQLIDALRDPTVGAIMAVRGGYGCSDLLDRIPWEELRTIRPKPIVGFSDISALHSAFYSQLGWKGIHGPMPATSKWQTGTDGHIETLLAIIQGQRPILSLPIRYLGHGFAPALNGWGFGGCLSVLTNLIGTAFFPKTLEGSLLFWEDVGEHPARILRFINQWRLSGVLQGVEGIILGRFLDCEKSHQSTEMQLCEEIARRVHIPVWYCPLFGHSSPNWPLPIGSGLQIDSGTLTWDWEKPYG